MKVSVSGGQAILFACVFSATTVARADHFFSRMSGQADSDTAAATYADMVPSFDIINVKVLCKDKDGTYSTTRFQPLISDEAGVEARIANIQMSPSNIQMYVTYYVGTNVWGADNWPVGQTVTKPMVPVPGNPLVYRTSPANDIPIQQKDQVVQYLVWASYLGGVPLSKQQETFDNPAWYFPVDLNQTFAAQGWSPYYVVYGVPIGAVWLNEINATDYVSSNGVQQVGIWDNSYIEIAVPAGVDLAGWKIDLVQSDYSKRTIEIPSGLPEQTAVTNGYAFFVIGDTYEQAGVPALPKIDYGCPGLKEAYYLPWILPGGLRLRRPLGMYEQAIAYDWNPDYGTPFSGMRWASNDPEQRFVYVGRENSGGSLGVKGITTTNWFFPQTWTPGWQNSGQTVPSAAVTLQGVAPVAAPAFVPPSGTAASNLLAVTVTSETAGAAICYTLDGSEPSAASAICSNTIILTQSATIKAKAFKAGMLDSATVNATYTLTVAGFDIVSVRVLCKDSDGTYSATRLQPLVAEEVGVEATIANVRLTPSNIQMYVSYYLGTNVWGVDNWPSNQIVTKPMYPTVDNPLVYRTSPTNDLPAQWTDQVVQYRVWANYWGGVTRQVAQKTFENSAWFYQVDLNEVFAPQGWSPFYIVYGPSGNAAWPLDIVSIRSDQANTTNTSSGTGIDFRVTLDGKFQLVNVNGGTFALLPEIRLIVNGDVACASLYSLRQYKVAAGTIDRTDVIFRYTVRSGDMAQPLQIYGPPATPYQFNWNGWEMRQVITDKAAVWKFNIGLSLPTEGEVCDPNLAGANITVRTLSFDEAHSPVSVAATESATWRVKTGIPGASADVDFYVWTQENHVLQLGSVSGQTALLVSLPQGATSVDFPIRGLATGTAEIYLQRVKDYQNNCTLGVTNYIKRTITVTPPSAPTIQLTMTDTLTDTTTLDETTNSNTGSFQIKLSQVFSNDITVGIATQPAGQSNVMFSVSPFLVTVPAGSLISPVARFSVADGTALSASAGVTLTPYVTNNAAAEACFARIMTGTVHVRNIKPTLRQPLATDAPTATRNVPYAFTWLVADVTADTSSGMTVIWDFNGESVTNVSGASGVVAHAFNTTGTKTITVTATDKDGAVSDEVQFTVTVVLPQPKAGVRVVAYAAGNPSTPVSEFAETTTNSTGSLVVYLTEPYSYDVYVGLTATVNGHGQSNIAFASTDPISIAQGTTNSQPVRFTLRDGTLESEINGVIITPSVIVTNVSPASSYFTDLQPVTVYVDNVCPAVTAPSARDISLPPLPQYTNVAMGCPFTFAYSVKDVGADTNSMVVMWTFGDGSSAEVTGAVGSVSHTYASRGTKYLTVQAQDKDGGQTDFIAFPIAVVSAPDGFALWAASKGLSGDLDILLGLDRDGDGVANGFEYAFGTNRTVGMPLLNIRMVDGKPIVETPKRDPNTTGALYIVVDGCTNLMSGIWTLPMGPSTLGSKPTDRDWYAPLVTVPDKAFFRLRAVRE